MSGKRLLCAMWVLLLPTLAKAQLDCLVPMREEGFEAHRPGAQALRRAARAAAAIVQKNSTFMAGRRPVRVRTTISYYGWDGQAASVITSAYNQKAWAGRDCKVSKFADRGGGLRDGVIALFINDPDAMMGGRLGDTDLIASPAPQPHAEFAGAPVYAVAGNADNHRALLSRAGYVPWVPVTVADALDWRERDLRRLEKERSDSARADDAPLDEAKIDQIYRDVAKVDPVAAAKGRAQMLESMAKARRAQGEQEAKATAAMARLRVAFDAYRASLTPAQLGEPARIGGAPGKDGVMRVDAPDGVPWARVDPAFRRKDPGRIHFIVVSLTLPPVTDPARPWMQESHAALDFKALRALLD